MGPRLAALGAQHLGREQKAHFRCQQAHGLNHQGNHPFHLVTLGCSQSLGIGDTELTTSPLSHTAWNGKEAASVALRIGR